MDTRTLRTLVFALVIITLMGLGGWYWYLRSEGVSIGSVSANRGLDSAAPRFTGGTGNTFENIVSGLGFQTESPAAAAEPVRPPRLWRVLATPAAGSGFVPEATSTILRTLERATGYLFETDVETGKTLRVTNALIPELYEARFGIRGNMVVQHIVGERPVVSLFTYHATTAPNATGDITQTSLGADVYAVPHPTKSEFLSVVGDAGSTLFVRSQWNKTKPGRVYESPLRDWHVHWLSDDSLYLAQKPASGILSSAYRVTSTGLTHIASLPGLTILPQAKTGAVLVGSDSGQISLRVQGAGTSTSVLPVRTITDKCVWVPEKLIAYCAVPQQISFGRFLDDWYQGMLHTSDSWWEIDAKSGATKEILSTHSEPLDVENPVINDKGEYIAFRNAYDKSVWVLRIAE